MSAAALNNIHGGLIPLEDAHDDYQGGPMELDPPEYGIDCHGANSGSGPDSCSGLDPHPGNLTPVPVPIDPNARTGVTNIMQESTGTETKVTGADLEAAVSNCQPGENTNRGTEASAKPGAGLATEKERSSAIGGMEMNAIFSAAQDDHVRVVTDERDTTDAVILPDDDGKLSVVSEAELVGLREAKAMHKDHENTPASPAKSKHFTQIDIKDAFVSVDLPRCFHEEEGPLAAQTAFGSFEFESRPLSIEQAPALLQRILQHGFDPLSKQDTLAMGDVMVSPAGILLDSDSQGILAGQASITKDRLNAANPETDAALNESSVGKTASWGFGLGRRCGDPDPVANYEAVRDWPLPDTTALRADFVSLSELILSRDWETEPVAKAHTVLERKERMPWTDAELNPVKQYCVDALRRAHQDPTDADLYLCTDAAADEQGLKGAVLLVKSCEACGPYGEDDVLNYNVIGVISKPLESICANFSNREKQFWTCVWAYKEWLSYFEAKMGGNGREAKVYWLPADTTITDDDLTGPTDDNRVISFLKRKLQSYNLKLGPGWPGHVNPATWAARMPQHPKPQPPIPPVPVYQAAVEDSDLDKEAGTEKAAADVRPGGHADDTVVESRGATKPLGDVPEPPSKELGNAVNGPFLRLTGEVKSAAGILDPVPAVSPESGEGGGGEEGKLPDEAIPNDAFISLTVPADASYTKTNSVPADMHWAALHEHDDRMSKDSEGGELKNTFCSHSDKDLGIGCDC